MGRFRWHLGVVLVEVWLCWSLPCSGRLFYKSCDLSNTEIVQVKTDGRIFYTDSGNDEGSRFLDEGSISLEDESSAEPDWPKLGQTRAVTVQRSTQQDLDSSAMESVAVRKCTCADGRSYEYEDFYCALPMNSCMIPSSESSFEGYQNDNLTPMCLYGNDSIKRARSLWPAVVAMYGILLICLCCTTTGRGVLHFLPGKLFPGWHEKLVNSIAEEDPRRANALILNYLHRRRREMRGQIQTDVSNDGEVDRRNVQLLLRNLQHQVGLQQLQNEEEEVFPTPTALALKTHVYLEADDVRKKDPDVTNQDSELWEEVSCTICFGPIVDGCRIGTLPCDHIFHVECLKSWLKRRNVCPLCQMPRVATPRFDTCANDDRITDTLETDEEQPGSDDQPGTTTGEDESPVEDAPPRRRAPAPRWRNLMNDFMLANPQRRPSHGHSA